MNISTLVRGSIISFYHLTRATSLQESKPACLLTESLNGIK
jgi:hypothetical protein